VNEEAMAHWRAVVPITKKKILIQEYNIIHHINVSLYPTDEFVRIT